MKQALVRGTVLGLVASLILLLVGFAFVVAADSMDGGI